MVDGDQEQPEQAGSQLAEAARAGVFFPTKLDLAFVNQPGAEQGEVFPMAALPIRADRETVYLSRGTAPVQISLSNTNARSDWKASPVEPQDENAFLATMVQRAARDEINVPAIDCWLSLAAGSFSELPN